MENIEKVLSGLTFNEVKESAKELLKTPLLSNGKDYKEWVLSKGLNGKTYSLVLGWNKFKSFASSSVLKSILDDMVYGDKFGFDCIYFNLCSCKSGKNPRFFTDWDIEECGNYILNDDQLKSIFDFFKSDDFKDIVYNKISVEEGDL